jgi:uncharacterized membrane protein
MGYRKYIMKFRNIFVSIVIATTMIISAQIALPTFQAVHKPHTPATPPNVLIIWDNSSSNSNTLSLKSALEDEGFTVSLSSTNESSYNGTNPALSSYDAVIHLNGTTYNSDMPSGGQNALVDFVNTQGGLYIHTEWTAWAVPQRTHYSNMTELILFNYSSYGDGNNIYTEVNAQSSHQILSDVPSSFSVSCGYNKGTAKTFESNPVTVLMTDSGSDGIVIREYGNGKIMGMSHAGNWDYPTLSNTNIQQLYINAINWAN